MILQSKSFFIHLVVVHFLAFLSLHTLIKGAVRLGRAGWRAGRCAGRNVDLGQHVLKTTTKQVLLPWR